MQKLYVNGLKIEFDKVIEFEQEENNLLECFFFKGEKLITSQYLTLFEFEKLKQDHKKSVKNLHGK